MNKKLQKNLNLSDVIIQGMKEKKATDITIMNLKSIKNAIADYFIICTGNSDTQVDAISDSIESEVYKFMDQNPWHKEGQQNKEWILIDYIDIVVHIFKKERRNHYALEELWGDAMITNVNYELN